MSNIKTIIEEWAIKELDDGAFLHVRFIACMEAGDENKPGIQVCFMGNSINDEPLITERWAYGASKANVDEYLPEDKSEMAHEDLYINNYFVTGSPLKAKIEVTSRSANPVSKAYVLAFEINQ